ncbi:MAG TPA: gluconokinase [Terriglobales bacterium]|nr:gluconokinase [Terriglobales bacterium]
MIVIVMGVTGSGKSTVGSRLARELGWEFLDGDSLHPAANVEKMHRGISLTDADRLPWLRAVRTAIEERMAQGKSLVVACSALKQSYRDELKLSPEVSFVYLKGGFELIAERLRARHGHFATAAILEGQFRDLQEPEDAIAEDIGKPPLQIVEDIKRQLPALGRQKHERRN